MKKLSVGFLLLFTNFFLVPPVSAEAPSLQNLGWVEKIAVGKNGFVLHAKLDTGADNCSLHSKHIEQYEKGDELWVRFTMTNRHGETAEFERPLEKITKIKRKKKKPQKRPVVKVGICLGNTYKFVSCNLVDRSNFSYPALVGRNLLAGNVLVDSSKSYTVRPECSS